MQPHPTRTYRDRFGDMQTIYVGADAVRIRAQVKSEAAVALARYDADPSPANLAAFSALASDIEAVVAHRLSSLSQVAA